MYDLQQKTAPTTEPITYGEVKHNLSLCHDDDVSWIENNLIKAARKVAEKDTHRQILTATWVMYLDSFPARGYPLYMPKGQFQSLTEIRYTDGDNNVVPLSPSEFIIKGGPDTTRIVPSSGDWPGCYNIEIEWVCGYPDRESVDEDLRQGMIQLASYLYEDGRQDVVVGAIVNQVPNSSREMFDRCRLGDAFLEYDTTSRNYHL